MSLMRITLNRRKSFTFKIYTSQKFYIYNKKHESKVQRHLFTNTRLNRSVLTLGRI